MLHKAVTLLAVSAALIASAIQAQTLDQTLSGCNGAAPLRTIQASPSDYLSKLASLIAGDRLLLAAGTYTQGLSIHNKNGQPGQCIVIEGPASGSPALFTGSDSWNVVSLADSSYIAVRNLSLDGLDKAGDGVKAEAGAVSVHHILIEGLNISNFNPNYLRVGISTKCPAWNWVIRRNTITTTGTGMYLGNSDGTREFVNGLIEYNLVYDTMDYNIQVKHQIGRSTSIGVPSSGTTIIRHNVFSKQTGGTGPNLLVGHWPLSGPGSTDIYQIYGNLLYENSSPNESLFQGEGNIAFHDNLLVNHSYEGIRIQPHNDVPRRIEIFNNTVIADGNGIRIAGADTAYTQRVTGNAVFAGTPLTGGLQSNNVTGTMAAASTYLNNPTAALGAGLALYPKSGQLQGSAIDYSPFTGHLEYDRDFNSRPRITTYRGAYSGDGTNPGWTPALAIKPEPSSGGGSSELQNGVPVTGLSGTLGSQRFWTMSLPSGVSNLQFQMSGGSGDADLYVRFGSAPTMSTYDCRPFASGNNETCTFPSPAAGTWHVMVVGDDPYSGMTLVGSYQTGGGPGNVLQNGVPVGISGTLGSQQFWTMSVPSGASNLQFQMSGGTGDADLYVRFGSAPTMTTYDCRPFASGNNETCTFPSPAAGTWHVMVVGDDPYSGATLMGSYQTGGSGNVLQNGVPVSNLAGGLGSQQFWTMSVPSGASNLQFQMSGGTGDADLYVRFGSAPTMSTYDCRPFASGNNETCTFPSPAAGTWHVLIVGDDPYSGVTLVGSYQTGSSCNSISDVEPNDSTAAPQAISGSCNQIAGTFVGETAANDYFRLSLPAGATVTGLLNALTADYDLFLYNAAGTEVAKSINGGTTADQASWTNTGSAAVNVYIRVNRYSSTKATYQLRISY
ncbi:MAG TPA: pre-peptidase C-terminal domain-containing protein [Thermoanaerobaculia bacterium]|nr:pre-peptidase C-terminal domain-containing protein [Thermoanaerobaculia bacterium]